MDHPIVYIVYGRVLSLDGSELTVGGVQTYLMNLAYVIRDMGWRPIIVQKGETDFDKTVNGITIRGRSVADGLHLYDRLYKTFQSEAVKGRDIIVWGSFARAPDVREHKTITIQHGIGFDLMFATKDIPSLFNRTLVRCHLGKVYKFLQRHKTLSMFNRGRHKVCVDYNFLNWYRTFSLRHDDSNITVIPNFTEIPEFVLDDKQAFRRIVFARRFSYERGTTLMVDAAQELLSRHSDISITFAGRGPYESAIQALKTKFDKRVEITEYDADQSIEFHRQFDIAVVPSIGSEGTSLSALESMAAGCALVCSNVGGLTNIVIDQFNGLIVTPIRQEVVEAIEAIVKSPELGNRLRTNGRRTVEQGFSRQQWAAKWKQVLLQV